MSVIIESEKGNELVILADFCGSPHGEVRSRETRRHFRIGERVRFAGYYRDEHFKDHPVGWMVLFDAADGKRYAATQTYFVTEECWQNLKKFFARSRRRQTVAKRRKVSS